MGSPQARSKKKIIVKVHLLDDTVPTFSLHPKCLGRDLFDMVCMKLSLVEVDYFGLEYEDFHGTKCFIDHERPLGKQLNSASDLIRFVVKFYTPDPGLLEDEFTRCLFALQIKRDLSSGCLYCHESTIILLVSYILQGELGDYSDELCKQPAYLNCLGTAPHVSADTRLKILSKHKELAGLSPAQADFQLLDIARKLDMYGIRLHSCKDHDGVLLGLAVSHSGILVYQNNTRINTFSWAKVRKLSFKRKKFLIKLHPEGYGYFKETVEFYFPSRDEAKNFWKKCIEHHSFFRCASAVFKPPPKSRIVSRGSSFRYSGRTQKQLLEYVRENYVKLKRDTPYLDRAVSPSSHTGANSVRSGITGPLSGAPYSTTNSKASHDFSERHETSPNRSVMPMQREYAQTPSSAGGERTDASSTTGSHIIRDEHLRLYDKASDSEATEDNRPPFSL